MISNFDHLVLNKSFVIKNFRDNHRGMIDYNSGIASYQKLIAIVNSLSVEYSSRVDTRKMY